MNIEELKFLIRDFDDSEPIVVCDDYGWCNIFSVEVKDDKICLVTESSDYTLGVARIL